MTIQQQEQLNKHHWQVCTQNDHWATSSGKQWQAVASTHHQLVCAVQHFQAKVDAADQHHFSVMQPGLRYNTYKHTGMLR